MTDQPMRMLTKRPILGSIAISLAALPLAAMEWVAKQGPSGHLGSLVIGEFFLVASAFTGACSIVCAVGSWARRERYRFLGAIAVGVAALAFSKLRPYF